MRSRSWPPQGPRALHRPADWTEPFPPFRIAGNLYYVGSKGLANYLITTPQGHILINSDLEANVPLIRASVEKLGFKFSDVKILLISHAHWDHDAGSALIKQLTGAKYMVMDADVPVVESGGKTDFQYGNDRATLYPADEGRSRPSRRRRGQARRRRARRASHARPHEGLHHVDDEGHGRRQDLRRRHRRQPQRESPATSSSTTPTYPQIAEDYERMFRVLKSLPCDFFLGAHGAYFDLEGEVRAHEGGRGVAVHRRRRLQEVRDSERAGVSKRAREAAWRGGSVAGMLRRH